MKLPQNITHDRNYCVIITQNFIRQYVSKQNITVKLIIVSYKLNLGEKIFDQIDIPRVAIKYSKNNLIQIIIFDINEVNNSLHQLREI